MIRVSVRNLAGDEFVSDVDHGCTVADLKENVKQFWQIPVECQQLILGTDVLLDSLCIAGALPSDGTQRTLTLVISLDVVRQQLQHGYEHSKVHALESLAVLGGRAADAGLKSEEVGALTGAVDRGVRLAALLTLCAVARGDGRDASAVATAVGCLADVDWCVRRAAVQALAELAEQGDQAVVLSLCARLADASDAVRGAAVNALAASAKKGDNDVIAAVQDLLRHADRRVRSAALQAMLSVAERGDDQVTSCVRALLSDTSASVQRHAAAVLEELL